MVVGGARRAGGAGGGAEDAGAGARDLAEVREAQGLLHETQKELHHSEERAGNLELFIVLVYVLEMAHILGEMTHAKHAFSLAMPVAGTVVGLVLVVLIVKKKPGELHDWLGEKRLVPLAMAMLIVYFVGLLVPVWVPGLQQPHPVGVGSKAPEEAGKATLSGH
jgi:hypothetical protein